MADLQEQIKTARAAGYSDDDIIKHLSNTDQRVKTAIDAGYKPNEIIGHLQSRSQPQMSTVPGMEKLGTLPGVSAIPQTGRQSQIAQNLGVAPIPVTPKIGHPTLDAMADFIGNNVVEPGMNGLQRAGEGIAALTRPGVDAKSAAAHNVIAGVGEAASPYMATTALMNPGLAARAVVRGATGAAIGSTASHIVAPESPGVQDLSGDVGAMIGAGTTRPKPTVSSTEIPNAMLGGPRLPVAPALTEWIPGVGRYIEKYNKGAQMFNNVNAPSVEQVRGTPAPIPVNHPLARLPEEPVPAVEQVHGSLQIPSVAGYPQPQPQAVVTPPAPAVEQVHGSLKLPSTAGYPRPSKPPKVPPVETTSGSASGSVSGGTGSGGIGKVYDWYTEGHGGHQQAIDVALNDHFKGVSPDSITLEQMNAGRKAIGKTEVESTTKRPMTKEQMNARLEQFKSTLKAERAKAQLVR